MPKEGESGPRNAPLDMPPEEFRQLGHALVDQVADFLAGLPQRPVTRGSTPEEVLRSLDLSCGMPDRGADPASLLAEASRFLFEHSLFNGHPRFWGYITSSAAPIGLLADLLAGAVNSNVGAWKLSPAATAIEVQTVRWIAELIGYPASCGGLLVSGGNMANFVCFLAARTAMADWEVRERGLLGAQRPQLRVYVSSETHTWVQKACDLFGLGTDSIRWLPVGRTRCMDPALLDRQIRLDREAGDLPLLVAATAGSVSTGAVDPLPELLEVSREHRLWFHVDGAYGAFAAMLPEASPDLKGLSEADSVALDPHKWLYAPLEAGCALVRDPEALRKAFSYHPLYYHFDEDEINFVDFGPQNSRGFRALKVWLALRQSGREGYTRMISDDIRLSKALFQRVSRNVELEALTQSLSISTFRFMPVDLRPLAGSEKVEGYLNRLNQEILNRLERGGEVFLSNALIDGKFALRMCIVNFRTTQADIEALPEVVVRTGREIDSELRKGRTP